MEPQTPTNLPTNNDLNFQVMPKADGHYESTAEPMQQVPAAAPVPPRPVAPVAPISMRPSSTGPGPLPPPLNSNPVPPSANLPYEPIPSIWHNRWLYIIGGAVILIILGLGIWLFAGSGNENKSTNEVSTAKVPKVWLTQYFGKDVCDDQSVCGDNADADSDGLANYDEFVAGSSPVNPDADKDGLADGDEVHIYKTNPTNKFTDSRSIASEKNFTDSVEIIGGYDPLTPGVKFTDARLAQIETDKTAKPLHEPSITTLKVDSTKPVTTTPESKTVTVNIEGGKFIPASFTIKAGDSVVWLNKDAAQHHVASDPHPAHTALPGLESTDLTQGQTYSFKFTQIGTWGYHDHLNPGAKGTVIVQ